MEKEYPALFADPSTVTVWSGIQWGVKWNGKTEVIEQTIPVPGYAKSVRYLLALQTDTVKESDPQTGKSIEKKVVRRAPVVIFLPGMFTDVESSRARRFLEVFGERGFHVILVPNPWSEHALESLPAVLPGHIAEEGAAAWELSSRALAILKAAYPGKIGKVNLAGESYGTILAATFLAHDHAQPVSLIDGETTLFSPILKMVDTLEGLDAMMDRTENAYAGWSAFSIFRRTWNYVWAKRQDDLDDDQVKDGETMLAYEGFGRNLVASLYALEKYLPQGKIPEFPSKSERTAWELRVRFLRTYFDRYTPGLRAQYENERGSLAYWLDSAGWLTNGRLRVMMSADDVVNAGNAKDAAKVFRAPDLMLFPQGGHSGFLAYPWFDRFANRVFVPTVTKK